MSAIAYVSDAAYALAQKRAGAIAFCDGCRYVRRKGENYDSSGFWNRWQYVDGRWAVRRQYVGRHTDLR